MLEATNGDDVAARQPRRLARPVERAQVAGVAAGLGEHLGVAPLVLRAIFAVLAAWQFLGVGVYLLLWLVIPPVTGPRRAGRASFPRIS